MTEADIMLYGSVIWADGSVKIRIYIFILISTYIHAYLLTLNYFIH